MKFKKYINEELTNAEHIHKAVENWLRKYYDKKAKIKNMGIKKGKSSILVSKNNKDYVISISSK